jgi:hypothetical protein
VFGKAIVGYQWPPCPDFAVANCDRKLFQPLEEVAICDHLAFLTAPMLHGLRAMVKAIRFANLVRTRQTLAV